MTAKKSKSKSDETQEQKAKRPLPKTHDKDGNLISLTRHDFPSSREGKIKYAEYQIESWKIKLAKAKEIPSPKDKMQSRLEKLRAKAAALEAELAQLS